MLDIRRIKANLEYISGHGNKVLPKYENYFRIHEST